MVAGCCAAGRGEVRQGAGLTAGLGAGLRDVVVCVGHPNHLAQVDNPASRLSDCSLPPCLTHCEVLVDP